MSKNGSRKSVGDSCRRHLGAGGSSGDQTWPHVLKGKMRGHNVEGEKKRGIQAAATVLGLSHWKHGVTIN